MQACVQYDSEAGETFDFLYIYLAKELISWKYLSGDGAQLQICIWSILLQRAYLHMGLTVANWLQLTNRSCMLATVARP